MPPGAPRNKPMDARMTAAESEPGVVLTQDIRVLAGLQRGTVNLSSPRAIFAGSPPRFTRSRVTYEAYAVSRTSTRPQVDSALSEPKTERSRRTVPLPATVVAMLRRHRTEQKQERLRVGDQWTDTGLVFTTEFGEAVDPRNLLRVVEGAAKTAGIAGVGVHTLRHSAAVGWLESGVHIKAVADLLGHSSISITGDIYGHTTDTAARGAVDGWSGALGL